MKTQQHPETLMIHSPKVQLPPGNTPLVSPVHHSVKYVPKDAAHLRSILMDRSRGFFYSRVTNPTVRELELLLAKLQGREDALCLASGMAALSTAILGLVVAGDHVGMFRESYKPTRLLLKTILAKLNVKISILSIDDLPNLPSILSSAPAKLLLLESPTNPILRLPDLAAATTFCRQSGTLTLLDNTFAGFLHHGDLPIDLYIHSLTKHACGHSDAMGGCIIADKVLIETIAPTAITLGATLDPNAAWLIARGMKTYTLRTKAASDSAAKIAEWLKQRRGIHNVIYPKDPSHPDYRNWQKQMKGDGGSVIAFDLSGDTATADRFIESLKIFALTPSLGCVESLVTPCRSLFADDLSADDARRAGIRDTTIRLAIGIEHTDDLIADLEQGLLACGITP